MLKKILSNLEGDLVIWAVTATLMMFSFLPVYSSSTNLVYVLGYGTTFSHLLKHALIVTMGFGIIYLIHKINYRHFSSFSVILLIPIIGLLIFTLLKETVIQGANASRWIQIPFIGISFQSSTLAFLVILIYTARYLSKNKDKNIIFSESLLRLWLPVGCVLTLILPANFSTAAILFLMVICLCFIGGYSIKYIFFILGIGVAFLSFFILITLAFPKLINTRVNTMINRVEKFVEEEKEGYQIEKSKTAIWLGQWFGRGAGKSVAKNFLPQSYSDFIFAIIIEEYGLLCGGVIIVGLYLLLLFRILLVARKAPTYFGSLLVIGIGTSIIFQAFINMGVAVNILPVTGQPLPLISSGGTSLWITCAAIGIILSVSSSKDEKTCKLNLIENENLLK